jgi:superfamily II DNA or RNA helicase
MSTIKKKKINESTTKKIKIKKNPPIKKLTNIIQNSRQLSTTKKIIIKKNPSIKKLTNIIQNSRQLSDINSKRELTIIQQRMNEIVSNNKYLKYEVHEAGAGGDCLFYSIIKAFKHDSKIPSKYPSSSKFNVATLRSKLVSMDDKYPIEEFRQNILTLRGDMSAKDIINIEDNDVNMQHIIQDSKYAKTTNTFNKHVKSSNFWANEWVISKIAWMLNIKFIIFNEDNTTFITYNNDDVVHPEYYVFIYKTTIHYQFVTYDNKAVFTKQELPKHILDIINKQIPLQTTNINNNAKRQLSNGNYNNAERQLSNGNYNNAERQLSDDNYNNIEHPNNTTHNNVNRSNMIQPSEWVLPNKKNFISWINNTFLQYKIEDMSELERNKNAPFKLFSYQKFIRDYMQGNSPNRGILLYHGLGSGKTCTSIAVAETVETSRKIIIMLPASLKANYIKQLQFCGNPNYKDNVTLIKSKYHFISYNSSTKLKQITDLGKFALDNKLLIIDEIHNLVSMMLNEEQAGRQIYKKIMQARNLKIVCLSGTPFINTPFEAAFLFNMLKGHIESISFTINGTVSGKQIKMKELTTFAQQLSITIPEIDFVNDIQYAANKLNIYLAINHWNYNFNNVIKSIVDFAATNDINIQPIINERESIAINTETLFPENIDQFQSYFINNIDEYTQEFKEHNMFMRRIQGLVSYVKGENDKLYPAIKAEHVEELPMSDYQFRIYETIRREYERPQERRSIAIKSTGNKSKKKNTAMSSVRVYSRQTCNFVFPEIVRRPYPEKLMNKIYKQKNKDTVKYNNSLDEDEGEGSIAKKLQTKINTLFMQMEENADTWLTNGPEGLDKYSPKMKKLLDNINKSPGSCLIYSQFRRVEGLEIFIRILNANGFQQFNPLNNTNDKHTYGIYSGMEKDKDKADMINTFNSFENRNGERIKIFLTTAAGAEGIDLRNLRQIHIMEPYWHEVRIQQVIGRGRRMNSHIDLPIHDRNIEIFRYLMKFTPQQAESSEERVLKTTDEHILTTAIKKSELTNVLLDLIKKAAVDCHLNVKDHGLDCFTFGTNNSNLDGFAYKPNIRDDMAYLRDIQTTGLTHKVKSKLTMGILDQTNNIIYIKNSNLKQLVTISNQLTPINTSTISKKHIKVYVNIDTKQVYDFKSIKNKKHIIIGTVTRDGTFNKKK